MLNAVNYHFTIEPQTDLLADIDVWEPPVPGVFEEGHQHPYYEILVFRKGGGTHQMINDVLNVEDYSIHVLPGNNFHELKRAADTDGFEIVFSEVFLSQLQQFDTKTDYMDYFAEPRVLNLNRSDFGEFEVYFDQLLKNQQNKPIFYNLVSLVLLKIISADCPVNLITCDNPFKKNLLALINAHYKEKRNLEFYVSKFNMSLNTFQRHTKKAFGKSVIQLQNEKILQEVRFSLSQSNLTIKEISMDFNFSDESHFNHFFRKHTGISPSEYRKSSLS